MEAKDNKVQPLICDCEGVFSTTVGTCPHCKTEYRIPPDDYVPKPPTKINWVENTNKESAEEAKTESPKITLEVSPQFCPKCSPDTWANNKSQIFPDIQICTSCRHERKFNVEELKSLEELSEAQWDVVKKAHEDVCGSEGIEAVNSMAQITRWLIEEGYNPYEN